MDAYGYSDGRTSQLSKFPAAFIQNIQLKSQGLFIWTGLPNPRIITEIPANPVCMAISGLCTLHNLTPL